VIAKEKHNKMMLFLIIAAALACIVATEIHRSNHWLATRIVGSSQRAHGLSQRRK
jgi:hypothetical protein